jgi:hypothetical protein
VKKDSDLHYCCNKNSPLQQLRRDCTDIHPGAVGSGAAWGGFHQHRWCKPVSQPFLIGYIKQLIEVIMSIYLQLLPLTPFKLKCRYNWQWGSSASNMSGEFSSLSSLVLHESSKKFHTSSITLAFCQHPVYLKTWEDNHLWFKKLGVEELLSSASRFSFYFTQVPRSDHFDTRHYCDENWDPGGSALVLPCSCSSAWR